ncbi:MAG TPA: histidine kinase [Pelobium sp.]
MVSKRTILVLAFSFGVVFSTFANFITEQLQTVRPAVKKELAIAKKQISNNLLDSALLTLQNAKNILPEAADPDSEINRIAYLKVFLDFLIRSDKNEQAIKVAEELLQASSKIGNQLEMAESYYFLAIAKRKLGLLKNAVEDITKGLAIAEKMGYKREEGRYHLFLASIFFELRDGKKSLFYSRKGYELLIQSGNGDLVKNKVTLPATEMLSGQNDLALKHLKQAEKNTNAKKEPFQAANIHLFKSHVYYEKKQFKLSLSELQKIPAYYRFTNKDYPDLPLHVEMAMAGTLCELKNFEQANFFFERNIATAQKKMDANDIKECFELGAKINEGLGNVSKSLKYLKRYIQFNDSINKLSVDKAIHETEVKYQTSVKEKAISDQKWMLAAKDNELYKKDRYIFIGISAFVLLVFAGFIGFLTYRNRHQNIRLNLLKAQIHPHFLFNTLNNLYALSMVKSDDAPDVVMGLANILRYALYECNASAVNLKKEMDIIAEYILLEKIRYGDGLQVNINNLNDLESYKIVPLLLLPLVENAYKHGASKLKHDCWINIETKIKGNTFVFKISNNKPNGLVDLPKRTEHGNIGLKNIQKRLEILYPRKHQLKITDGEDVFIVIMQVPVKTT